MPQKIICKECNEVLYVGTLLKSPHDVIKLFERKCPACGKELSFETEPYPSPPTKPHYDTSIHNAYAPKHPYLPG